MQELQWDRARRAIEESGRLVAESDALRKEVAETIVRTSSLIDGLMQATPKRLRNSAAMRGRRLSVHI